jgi:hypothetical protein
MAHRGQVLIKLQRRGSNLLGGGKRSEAQNLKELGF